MDNSTVAVLYFPGMFLSSAFLVQWSSINTLSPDHFMNKVSWCLSIFYME